MKLNNNTIIVFCCTIMVIAMLLALVFGLSNNEQVSLVLAGGLIGIGNTIAGNLQRKQNKKNKGE